MKTLACLVGIFCAGISALALSTFADILPPSQRWISVQMAFFLFVFFGIAALVLPILLALPREKKEGRNPGFDEVTIKD
jgi:hypothetical protein